MQNPLVSVAAPWPGEYDDTSHIEQGYYRRYDGTLGKIKNGVKLTESEASHSAKRARDPDVSSESKPESQPQEVEALGDEAEEAEETKEAGEAEKEISLQYDRYICINTFIENGEEISCDEETNGSSQLCHYCKQSFKRLVFGLK